VGEKLGHNKVAKLLGDTLAEEEKADKLLTQLSAPILDEASRESGSETEEETRSPARKAAARSKAANS